MSQNIRRQIIELVLKAATLAESIGIENLVQPGLVKEIIIADILGHELISSKRDADAPAFGNPNEKNMNIFAVKKVAVSSLTACSKNQKRSERKG